MAAADPPAGLMDIVSTLSPDEIPFKLRCAICSKLAVNAFRLPCCDQSICETCQPSLTDTCPVCAHTPVSPDLCKPNKALRTTLKAFLRTEEKKREKERQSATPLTPTIPTPAESEQIPAKTPVEKTPAEATPAENAEAPPIETKTDESAPEVPATVTLVENQSNGNTVESGEPMTELMAEPEPNCGVPEAASTEAGAKLVNGDAAVEDEIPPSAQDPAQQTGTNMMNMGPGGFPMGWNGNPMNSFMGNGMFNFPNPMGMPMTMDPMAANQGMFGDYGMNMTGMGMNMGMNFNGQGMYGSLGWDGSQQNMWQGGQDKFNPNAFANGTGPPYGGAFGGSNMSYHSNPDFQSGSGYGSGYGRGGYRGRGRGYFGPGRGGFAGPANQPFSNQAISNEGTDGMPAGTDASEQVNESGAEHVSENTPDGNTDTNADQISGDTNGQQLQGIPTIDSLDQSMSAGMNGFQGPMGPGYGRGGYMRGSGRGYWGGPAGSYQPQMQQPQMQQPRGLGVEGAPAAPRAMRQGLPNTSVFRQRGGFHQARGSRGSSTPGHQSGVSETPKDSTEPRSPSKAQSQPPRTGSRSRSPSQSRASRPRSPVANGIDGDRENSRKQDVRRADHDRVSRLDDRRSRSQSRVSSRRPSRSRHREGDRDRRDNHRSHRSRRHGHSRSRSPSRNGPSRNGEGNSDRVTVIKDENEANGRKTPSEAGDLTGRISSRRSGKDRPIRREDDPRPQSRRVKRSPDEYPDLPKPKAPEAEKDPYTLEREARNRERMLREQQNRGTKPSKSSRRDTRPERMVGGRPVNFKYEDEL
ncbi:uncharacterized protein N7443_007096 [Penicillium atrosanguineum]|uniref:uncharacterized protein n=1 Tax=Penicillium atrosanguineum TaxID=1132637 RepID=UPI002397C3A5|nr:uncharacterized protein N7443_007096 [Penicillium atrosanguineum]KAJ5298976.1 hypothetical protein N7443_007096 [Penicillium atrosanguineum]